MRERETKTCARPGKARVDILPAKRQALILGKLRSVEAVSIAELSRFVGASSSTIRRDLEHLEHQGALDRTHGGALLRGAGIATFEPEIDVAAEFARREKEAIGRFVAARLKPGQSVVFDAGTTVMEAARRVAAARLSITAITNSLAIAQVLAGVREIRLIVPGGVIRPGTMSLVGRPGEDFLASIHADVALIGVHAIAGTVFSETSLEAASMKRASIAAADRAIVLADSSKLGSRSLFGICEAAAIHELVTDSGAPRKHLAPLEAAGTKVRVVSPE